MHCWALMYAVFWELGMSCLITTCEFQRIKREETREASYQDLRTSGLVQVPGAAAAVPNIAAETRSCAHLAMMVSFACLVDGVMVNQVFSQSPPPSPVPTELGMLYSWGHVPLGISASHCVPTSGIASRVNMLCNLRPDPNWQLGILYGLVTFSPCPTGQSGEKNWRMYLWLHIR
jgi:hypothetical protein